MRDGGKTSGGIKLSNKIVFAGGGGHCRSVIDSYIRLVGAPDVVITDARIASGFKVMGFPVVGGDDMLSALYADGYWQMAITLGSIKNTTSRRRIFEKADAIGFSFPNIADFSSEVSESVNLGKGIYVGKNAVINANTIIGDSAIINTGAIVEHDCRIGEFSHIAVGAVVCGGCELGRDVFVGANATVVQEVKIGKGSIIGAGSTVLADVPEGMTVTGIWK